MLFYEQQYNLDDLAHLQHPGPDNSTSLLQEKMSGVAKALNKGFLEQNPDKYPHERTGFTVCEKWRSSHARYKQEKKLQNNFDAAAQGTGSAAGTEVRELDSKWPLFQVFYECCVKGDPSDADEQKALGIIQSSVVPGIQQRQPLGDVTGKQPVLA